MSTSRAATHASRHPRPRWGQVRSRPSAPPDSANLVTCAHNTRVQIILLPPGAPTGIGGHSGKQVATIAIGTESAVWTHFGPRTAATVPAHSSTRDTYVRAATHSRCGAAARTAAAQGQQVGPCRVGDRGASGLASDRAGQAQLGHQPLHGAAGHTDALAVERQPHFAGPIHTVVGRMDAFDLGFKILIAGLPVAGLTIELGVVGRWGDRHTQRGQLRADRLDTPPQAIRAITVARAVFSAPMPIPANPRNLQQSSPRLIWDPQRRPQPASASTSSLTPAIRGDSVNAKALARPIWPRVSSIAGCSSVVSPFERHLSSKLSSIRHSTTQIEPRDPQKT